MFHFQANLMFGAGGGWRCGGEGCIFRGRETLSFSSASIPNGALRAKSFLPEYRLHFQRATREAYRKSKNTKAPAKRGY